MSLIVKKKFVGIKISNLKDEIASPLKEEAINIQLQEIRNEWNQIFNLIDTSVAIKYLNYSVPNLAIR